MIDMVLTGLSWLLIVAGAFFVVVGGLGLLRMPDVFTRMHAASVTDTVGAGLMLLGMMLAAGFSLISVKLAIILLVILFTSPVATHALAQAALHAGLDPLLAKGGGRRSEASTDESSTGMTPAKGTRRSSSKPS